MAIHPAMSPVRVSPDKLRELFRDGQYPARIQAGEFRAVIYSETIVRPPNRIASQEPPGTKSQMIEYLDSMRNRIALVHRYLRPDGTLGASGKEDPKALVHNGVYYILEAH
jgi:hypothetical protein